MPDIQFPRLSLRERGRFTLLHTLPTFLGGIIFARPRMREFLNTLRTEERMVRFLEQLRRKYGGSPVWASTPSGPALLLLDAWDVERVLSGDTRLYSLDTQEKVEMLSAFQPNGVIISRGDLRVQRRELNEAVLESREHQPSHTEHWLRIVDEEISEMLSPALRSHSLKWPAMQRSFSRISRRIAFGDVARDDVELSQLLNSLQSDGNWLGKLPWRQRRTEARSEEFARRISAYVEAAEPNSLAGRIADAPARDDIDPPGQMPQWLMALDLLGPVAMRAIVLLANHPHAEARAASEVHDAEVFHGSDSAAYIDAVPYLRATILEAARLWPLVPNLGRVTTSPVEWDGVLLDAETSILISATYFSRAPHRGVEANMFTPSLWLDGSDESNWEILPFGKGPGECAGKMFGAFLATAALASVVKRARLRSISPVWDPLAPLPVSFLSTGVRLTVASREDARLDPTTTGVVNINRESESE